MDLILITDGKCCSDQLSDLFWFWGNEGHENLKMLNCIFFFLKVHIMNFQISLLTKEITEK